MISVASISLEHGYTNCGSYGKLPWLATFTLRYFCLIAPEQLRRLLDVLETCEQQGLLTDDVRDQLAQTRNAVAFFQAGDSLTIPDGSYTDSEYKARTPESIACTPTAAT